jgi:methyl-accepting chemotaxis protein
LNDIRSILHALADRLADSIAASSPPPAAAQRSDGSDAQRAALQAALESIARGDLISRRPSGVSEETASLIVAALERVRQLARAAHESAHAGPRANTIIEAVERAASAGNQQRLALDRSSDELRPLVTRLDDLAQETAELAATGDRIALLALNTGIEGLRVGGEVARALGSLGDEIRRLSLRMAMSAREIGEALRSSSELTQRAMLSLEDARAALRQIADDVTRAAAAAESVRIADDSLREAARSFRVLDVESEAIVARLDELAERLAPDVSRARALAAQGGAEDIEAALARVMAALRGG